MQSSQIYERLDRNDGQWFKDIYGDIADATPLTGWWKARDLVGQLRTIEAYAAGYQSEIIACVLKRMVALQAPDHGLDRKPGGWFQWRFPDEADK